MELFVNKKIIISIFLILVAVTTFAQVSVDPLDPIYSDILAWENLGLTPNLPPLRPYPLPLIKSILLTVSECEYPEIVECAKKHYERIFTRNFYIGAEADARVKADSYLDEEHQVSASVQVFGDAELFNRAAIAYKLNVLATTDKDAGVLPMYKEYDYDAVDDAVDMGPLSAYTDMNVSTSYGTDKIYFQAGINRSSFGSFLDNSTVLGSQALHTGSISFVVNQEKWNFTQALLTISATRNNGTYSMPNKFMALHSLNYKFNKYLTLSYYENIVYGKRFDPTYFLPVPYMIAQGVGGFEDNLQMGISARVSAFKGLSWVTDLFVDDLSLNDLIRFNFDTKLVFALQSGVQYTPVNSLFSFMSMDYTLIAPYMYAHSEDEVDSITGEATAGTGSVLNYQNYTHHGKCMGSSLYPNSDRLALSIKFNPIKKLNIKVDSCFIRHANVCENLSLEEAKKYLAADEGDYLTDGSVLNHQEIDGTQIDSYKDSFLFMKQDTKMYVFQLGLNLEYALVTKKIGTFSVLAGWTLEYIHNYGVQNDIFKGTGVDYGSLTQADVDSAIATWKSQLIDIVNNYFTIGLKYVY